VIRRVVLEGWSLRRTAASLEISPMTVSRQLRRGLDELELGLLDEFRREHMSSSIDRWQDCEGEKT